MPIHEYPALEEVETADHLRLAFWKRFLSSPKGEEKTILNRIIDRLREFGGITPEISRQLGSGD